MNVGAGAEGRDSGSLLGTQEQNPGKKFGQGNPSGAWPPADVPGLERAFEKEIWHHPKKHVPSLRRVLEL
jgi:hypothetical protein